MKGKLPGVVRRLRELCLIDLTQGSFQDGSRSIYRAITGVEAPSAATGTAAGSLENLSYAEKKREIENLVAESNLQDAAIFTMDLRRGYFEHDQNGVRQATLLSQRIRQHQKTFEQEREKPGQVSIDFVKFYNDTLFEFAEEILSVIPSDLDSAA